MASLPADTSSPQVSGSATTSVVDLCVFQSKQEPTRLGGQSVKANGEDDFMQLV